MASQFEKDAKDLGFSVSGGMITAKGFPPGQLAGAQARVEQSTGEVSRSAKLMTSFKDRGKLVGKSRIFITVDCPGGVTVISEREPKHEMAARRFVAAVNAGRV
jgi:hypothetical protein